MPNQFKSKEFKDQLKVWNKKLKKSGFEDAENFDLDEPQLRQWSNVFRFRAECKERKGNDLGVFEFFQLARDVLETYKFKNQRERKIWALYSEGAYEKEISRMLKITRYRVTTTIRKIKQDNGLP